MSMTGLPAGASHLVRANRIRALACPTNRLIENSLLKKDFFSNEPPIDCPLEEELPRRIRRLYSSIRQHSQVGKGKL